MMMAMEIFSAAKFYDKHYTAMDKIITATLTGYLRNLSWNVSKQFVNYMAYQKTFGRSEHFVF